MVSTSKCYRNWRSMSFLKMSGKAHILFRSLCSFLSLPLPSDPLFLMWKFKIQSHVSSFKNMLWGVWDGRVHTAILKWITKKDLLSSTGNSAQGYVAAWMGGEFGGEWIPVYVRPSPFAIHLTLSQHYLLISYESESVSRSVKSNSLRLHGLPAPLSMELPRQEYWDG